MRINIKTGEVSIEDDTYNLTKNEILVLESLNKNRIVTKEELYENVYKAKTNKLSRYDEMIVYRTISRLRKKLKDKIVIHSRSGYGYEMKIKNKGGNNNGSK